MINSWGWGVGESHEGCIIGPSQGGSFSLKIESQFWGRQREKAR